jgi:hypothetical protein
MYTIDLDNYPAAEGDLAYPVKKKFLSCSLLGDA